MVKAAPILFILNSLISILHGISFAWITICTQNFLDKAAVFAKNEISIHKVIFSLSVLGFAYVGNKLLNSIFAFIYRIEGRKVQGKLTYHFNHKVSKLSAMLFEDTSFLEDEMKAYEGLNNSVWFSMTFLLTFTFYTPYFVYLATYLYLKQPVLVYSLLLAFLPMLLNQVLRTRLFMNLLDEITPIKRKYQYFNDCMTSREYYKETRMLGAYSYFNRYFKEALVLMNRLRMKTFTKANLFELSMKFLTGLSYAGILYLLYYYVVRANISIGVFVAVFTSIERLYGLMHELVCDHVTYLTEDLAGITKYITFMKLPERNGEDSDFIYNKDLKFKNVSFCYPGSKDAAISNISFQIKEKETIAIVGENGSGKSTLVRLLMGLYEPSKGDIFIGNMNTKETSLSSLVKPISAVFQKFQRYQLSLKDNITISELGKQLDEKMLNDILEQSGLNPNDPIFENGYDTILSREFDGVELSGGLWQRVAIARGYNKDHEIIVLDEPTAAIDPVEETRVYQQFAEICKDKTAILVTHRLGSAKIADRIFVMKGGSLVESGTHEELKAQNGEYARLYSSQEQWYFT